jgi:uncharacterized protein GlcG (DUF336 family)
MGTFFASGANSSGALPIEGGIPLTADGEVIGAIGGSSQQDAHVAQAGVAAFKAMLKSGK